MTSAAYESFNEADRPASNGSAHDRSAEPLHATPFQWVEPCLIPTRKWLFGHHAIRKHISATVAAGGTGKTANVIAESVGLVTGRDLFNDKSMAAGHAWYIGLEDPYEEYLRRVAAACIHHRISQPDLVGGFFLDSGRDQNFVIAREDRGGLVIAEPIVKAIIAQVKFHDIALLTVDPFVASHQVRENDNGAIEVVARTWAQIADETGAAIELVHHVRKTPPGQELSADDARGARALVDKARSVRLLSGMTTEEAAKAGVDEHRRFFRMRFGKANLALPPDEDTWRQLVSVSLGNGAGGPDDLVGVAAPWRWPNAFDDVTVSHLLAVQKRINEGQWRENVQSAAWAGKAVGDVLDIDPDDDASKQKIKQLLKTWLKSGALRVEKGEDEKRNKRNFVKVGQWANA